MALIYCLPLQVKSEFNGSKTKGDDFNGAGKGTAIIDMLFVGFSYSWVLFLIVFIFLIFIGDFQQSADCTACPAAKHGSFFVQDYFLTFKNL